MFCIITNCLTFSDHPLDGRRCLSAALGYVDSYVVDVTVFNKRQLPVRNIKIKMFQIEQLKQLYKMYLEKRQQEDKVFEGLTYFLHKSIWRFYLGICCNLQNVIICVLAPQLTKLFFSWIDLSNIEKYIFSFQMLQSFPGNKHYLYSSILKAFDLWSTIQDTQGM